MDLSMVDARVPVVPACADRASFHVTRLAIRRGSTRVPDRIEIETSAGISGYGEGLWGEEALRDAPKLLIGRSPFEAEAIFEDLSAVGPAAGGLDMALWDAAARAACLPACELLGKVYRKEVRTTSSLCVDGVEFLEEPLAVHDLDGYRCLKDTRTQPVAAGRTFPLDVLLRDFIQTELIDLALPDITRAGLTGLRRLAYFCWVFRIRLGVICPGTPLTTAAALQAAACFVPVTRAIAVPPPFLLLPGVGRNVLAVPDGPGLGMDPDWRALAPDSILGG